MSAGEKLSADDVVVVDLDAPGDHEEPSTSATGDRPTSRGHRIVLAAAGVGLLGLGVFLGHTNARNTGDNEVRIFTGDIVIGSFTTEDTVWRAGLTVINDAGSPVDVIGLDLPGHEVGMISDIVTVPASGRATVDLRIAADCDADAGIDDGSRPLTLTVTAAGTDHTVETTTALAPTGMAAVLRGQCQRAAESLASVTTLEVTSTDPAPPGDTLAGRVGLRVGSTDVDADIIGVRSLIPGFTITADDVPRAVVSRPSMTFIDVTWTVADCELATTISGSLGGQAQVESRIRTETDGTATDTAIQGSVNDEVAFQLGLLAASSCAS